MRLLKALVVTGLFAFALNAHSSAQAPNGNRVVAGQILVKFTPGTNGQAKAAAHRQGGGRVQSEIAETGLQLVAVPAGDETGAINRYRRNPNVMYAEPNFIRSIPEPVSGSTPTNHVPGTEAIPGDHMFKEQWALHNTGQQFYCPIPAWPDFCFYAGTPDADTDAPEAWAISTGNAITVAVIDTGIDYTHPDLAGNYAGGIDYVTPDGDPMDDHGHGTHVSGTIAAAMNNLTGDPAQEEGVVGVAPFARIRAYKVCDANGSCSDFAIQQAIVQAVADGAKVINMSLGGAERSQGLDDAVQFAWNAGLVIVAGAGNDGNTNLFYPAAFDHVISVGAFDEDHRRATFSNYGDWVDISAPGNVILSTYPMDACAPSTEPGDIGCYNWLSGTSMATPHVSGAAALVWSRGDVTSNQQVVDILLNSADPQGVDPVRLDSWTIHGGLNLHDAMAGWISPPTLPRVTVSAGPIKPLEAGPTSGAFVLARDGDVSAALDVNFDITGTATSGADYVPVSNMASFAAGASTAVVPITPIDDLLVEPDETVVLTISGGAGYIPGSPSSASLKIGSDDLPPDLIVSAFTAPAVGGAGLSITVNDTTKNQGGGSSVATLTTFYLSANAVLDAPDIQLGTRDVPALLPGGTNAGPSTLTIPANTAGGSYYIHAKVDAANTITETLENNNVRTAGPVRIGPDLTITSLNAPAAAGDGDTITVSDITTNAGGGNAGPSRTALYLSTNLAWDAADKPIGGRDIGPLGVNGASSAQTQAVIPSGTTGGLYYVIARADDLNAVTESQETNNIRASASIKIGPDLIVSALTVPSSGAGAGGTVTVSDTTKNQGAGTPTAASTTAFYLSTNTAFDASDRLVGTRPVMALAAGQTQMVSTPLQIPTDVATGNYFILARADVNNDVVESVESNNVNFAPIKIGPDLTETALSVAGTAVPGGSINVTETTKNAGGGAAGPSTTKFYLSSNGLFDANDVFICSRDVGSLGAGGTSLATTPCTIPAGTAPGNMFLIGVVDGTGVVTETNETNNTLAVFITVKTS
jgi:thermitase